MFHGHLKHGTQNFINLWPFVCLFSLKMYQNFAYFVVPKFSLYKGKKLTSFLMIDQKRIDFLFFWHLADIFACVLEYDIISLILDIPHVTTSFLHTSKLVAINNIVTKWSMYQWSRWWYAVLPIVKSDSISLKLNLNKTSL